MLVAEGRVVMLLAVLAVLVAEGRVAAGVKMVQMEPLILAAVVAEVEVMVPITAAPAAPVLLFYLET